MFAHVLDDYPKSLDPVFDDLRLEKPFDYFFRRFDVVSLVVLKVQDIKDQFQMEASRGGRHHTCKMDLRTNPFEDGEYDTPWIEHRPARIMDKAQGGLLVYHLDQTETVRSDPSDHPDRTACAVHRIDPRTSILELSLEPRPRDGFDRPTSLLSQPIQHSKTDSQAIFNLVREESEDVHRFSLMALLVHHACPEGCPDVLASVPDPLMDFSHPYSTKAWKLSCLKTCLTPVHILVMKINWRVMWSVRRVCGSSRVCPILPIMDLHDQNEPGHLAEESFLFRSGNQETPLSFLGVFSSKLNASFLLDRCVTSGNRSSFASLSDL
ncbi:hypothetical protein YC2023_041075 [Brassica napus]